MSKPLRLEFPNALYHVTEMQKRIGREKDDLNIPQQQKWPIAKPLSEIAAQHKDRDAAIIAAYKTGGIQPARNRGALSIAPNDDWGYCSPSGSGTVLHIIP